MAVSITTQNIADVNNMYVALFGRAPDGEGLGYWARELAGTETVAGKSLVSIADAMFAVPPARAYYPVALTNKQIVESFYVNVLGRPADTEGSNYWTGQLNKAGATPGSVIVDMVFATLNFTPSGLPADAATDAAGAMSKTLFANKVAVSTYFGATNGSIAAGQVALTGVTADPASVVAAKAAIDAGQVVAGQTFTLTEGVDNIVGTGGNDTIIAGPGSSGGIGGVHTLGASDVINGGAGIDKIEIISADPAAQTLVPRMSNVENVFLQGVGGSGVTLNMVNATGVQQLWNNNSTDNLAVTNLAEKATVGVKGGNGANNFSVQAAPAALAGDLGVALNGAWVNNVVANSMGAGGAAGYASTTIDATGVNRVAALDVGSNLATVKVTGTGSVAVTGNLAASVRTIDASANAGGVDFNIANNTGNTTFTGGGGADRINFGVTLGLADKVDGGAGRDVLGVNSQVQITAGLQVSNVEVLELNTLNGTLNAAAIAGVDEVRVTTDLNNVSGVAIVNGLTSNSTFVTNDSGDVRLNITGAQVAGTLDTLNLKTGIAGFGGVNVMAAGVETVAYTQNNLAAGVANTTLFFYDTDGVVDMTKLTIASNAGNTVNANSLDNTIKTVDAGAAAGAVNVSIQGGNATNGVTITGGSGNDTLMGGDGKDVINGGAGNDNISGDQFFMIPGTGGLATPQVSTLTIANAEVGDTFTINGSNVVWTGIEATDNAAVIAAAATAGVTVTADAAGVTTAGTFTMTGASSGAAFGVPTVSNTNVAAKAEVSTVTINNAAVYDAGDVVAVNIDGTNYSVTTTAGQTAASVATALAVQINGGGTMGAVAGGAGNNVLTLIGAGATTNYTISATTTNIGGGAATQTAQISTVTLGGTAEAGDVFSVNVNGTVYQGSTTAALAAAIGTNGGLIASAVATSPTVLTLNGLAVGTAFSVAAGPSVNQPAVADTVTVDFTTVAAWDLGDAYRVNIDSVTVDTGALAADGGPAATGAAFVAAFYATTLPASGYSAVNAAGVVTVTGPAAGTNVALTAETNTQKAAVAQVQGINFTDTDWTDNGAGGALAVTVNGQTFIQTVAAATEADGEAAVVAIVNQINLAGLGVTATANNGVANVAGLTLIANVPGTPFIASGAQAGAALTPPVATNPVTTQNDTVTANVITAVDNNTGVAVGVNDQTMTIATPTPGVTTTTSANAAPVVVDNTFTAAGAPTQTMFITTPTAGQMSGDQYFGGPAAADILTGGDGNDMFWMLSGSSVLGGTMDTINNLNLGGGSSATGVDRIVLSASVFTAFGATDLLNAGTALNITGPTLAAGLQGLFNAGGALNGSANDVGLFTYGADTYLIASNSVAGYDAGDVVIKVTGVTGSLDLSDIVVM